jgi:Flp pilus assembly protein TadG
MHLNRFARDKKGVAAIEFALIAPVIILIFFGLIELSEGTACRERVEGVASTTSDLVAQTNQISDTGVANVFAAANAIIYPYPTGVTIVLTSLSDNGPGQGKVLWSDAQNGAAHTAGSILSVPTGVITTGGTVILSEVTYTYSSPSKFVLGSPVTMSSSFFSRPRRSAQVTRVP